jgi:hypothetical protein
MKCKSKHYKHFIKLYKTTIQTHQYHQIDAVKNKIYSIDVFCTNIQQQSGYDTEIGGQVASNPSVIKIQIYNLLIPMDSTGTLIAMDMKSNTARWGAEFNGEQYTVQAVEFENALLNGKYMYLLLKRNNDTGYI